MRQIFGFLVVLTLVGGGSTMAFALSFDTMADAAEQPSPPPLLQRTEDVVTADPLPTVQIDDGYVWAQTTIGSTVYAVGDFDNARAPLADPGTQLTPRSNVLAYDINTGDLLPFAPQVNGVIKAVAASPDGSRIYIGGSFTSVNGQARYNIAALDASTGQLVPGFAPSVGGAGVYALVTHGSMVYAGGLFTQANGTGRQNAAAFSASSGALMPWAPQTDLQIDAMVADPGGENIIIGGRFAHVNGDGSMRGTAAIDDETGAVDAGWALPQTVKNGLSTGGTAGKAGIFALTADDDAVYGTGWVYGGVALGNLEGTFAAEAGSGEVRWIADCLGDHYGVYSTGETVYTTSHTHACSTMDLHPEQNPREHRYAEAYTADARGLLAENPHAGSQYKDWEGTPGPSAYAWYPDFSVGTSSGLGQAGLSITGVGDTISIAGEFVGVNNQRFQGIVRFSTNPPQGAQDGPRLSGEDWQPTADSFVPGRVRVSVPGNWDRDDLDLTYELRRSDTSTPVATVTASSTWWDHPGVVLEDPTASPGSSATYTVVVRDGDGNSVTSSPVTATVAAGVASEYTTAVIDDAPQLYYPLGDTMQDWAGADPPTAGHGVIAGSPGIENSSTGYSGFGGSSSGRVATSSTTSAPEEFSTELWFRTTSSEGGKLIGYGSSASGESGSYDRHAYMTDSGEIVFGVHPGAVRTIRSAPGYNDGQWHHVVASQSADGMELYLDGEQVATDPSVTTAQSYTGHWRIGGDNLGGWPNRPSSNSFDGAIDEVAVYDRALDPSEVTTHYGIGKGLEAPTASFTASADALDVAVDAAGSSAAGDATIAEYRWDFGDGSPEVTGEAAAHTYAATGSYTVTLTVVDSNGLSETFTRTVDVTGPNTAPSAEIATDISGLTATADGSGSSDADGQIVSYDWDWGDGESSTGQVASHPYAAAGDYTVTLTVTDDRGGTAQKTAQVTVTHAAPTAQFTTAASGRSVDVDGGDSAASEGATLSYSWDWGDGTEVSEGRAASHSYEDDGDYDITLTVTDSLGSTDTLTQSVSVNSEAFAASDGFERTVASGWGSADIGGEWTSTGWNTAATSVGDGVGTMALAPGAGRDQLLAETSLTDSGSSMTYTLDAGPSTGSLYIGLKSRYVDGHAYRSLAWHRADGSVWLVIQRDDTVLAVLPASGQWGAGDSFQLRTEVVGDTTPTIRMKVWPEGTTEPSGWQLETTDSSADALTAAGSSSVYQYRSGSATGQAPVHVDDYRLAELAGTAAQRAAVAPAEDPEAADEQEPESSDEKPPAAPETEDSAQAEEPDAAPAQKTDPDAEKDDESTEDAAEAPEPDPDTSAEDSEPADETETEPEEAPEQPDPDVSDEDSEPVADDAPEPADDQPAEEPRAEGDPAPEGPASDEAPRAEDSFDRTAEAGWGDAPRGGAWTLADDSDATTSVADGSGRLDVAPGTTAGVLLDGPTISSASTELTFRVDEEAEPGGTSVGIIAGHDGDSPYRVEASMRPDGTVWLVVHHGEDVVVEQQLEGATFTPGTEYTLSVSATEDGETALAAKLWESGSEEPEDWQLTATADDLPTRPGTGQLGVTTTRADETGAPATVHVEEFTAVPQG